MCAHVKKLFIEEKKRMAVHERQFLWLRQKLCPRQRKACVSCKLGLFASKEYPQEDCKLGLSASREYPWEDCMGAVCDHDVVHRVIGKVLHEKLSSSMKVEVLLHHKMLLCACVLSN